MKINHMIANIHAFTNPIGIEKLNMSDPLLRMCNFHKKKLNSYIIGIKTNIISNLIGKCGCINVND
jgi:hypothetical protein